VTLRAIGTWAVFVGLRPPNQALRDAPAERAGLRKSFDHFDQSGCRVINSGEATPEMGYRRAGL
jgi:hypothetical protein